MERSHVVFTTPRGASKVYKSVACNYQPLDLRFPRGRVYYLLRFTDKISHSNTHVHLLNNCVVRPKDSPTFLRVRFWSCNPSWWTPGDIGRAQPTLIDTPNEAWSLRPHRVRGRRKWTRVENMPPPVVRSRVKLSA